MTLQPRGEVPGQKIPERRVPMVVEVPSIACEHFEFGAARRDLRSIIAEEIQAARLADRAELGGGRLADIEA
jgi:hypothetical protein